MHTTLDGPNIFVLNAINCDIIFLCNRKRNRGRKKRYTKYYSWPRNALKKWGKGEGGWGVGARWVAVQLQGGSPTHKWKTKCSGA